MVNLYKLLFLSSHFSFQPNKRVFHPPTFPSSHFSFSHFSILPQFFILPLFYSSNQTDPKAMICYYKNWKVEELVSINLSTASVNSSSSSRVP